MSHDCCHGKGHALEQAANHKDIRRVLIIVLMLNAMMFVVEFGAGLVAHSAALMADSVDMLGDAMVFGISLYALKRSLRWRAGSALIKGGFILLMGVGVLAEIAAKIVWGAQPVPSIMLIFGAIALIANLSCLALLWPYRRHDVNLASTFECARNDVLANLGVLAAAGLVSLTDAAWPDAVVAAVIAFMFLRSSLRVIADAWPQYRSTMRVAAH
jgi:Co/Zn/Cd efflux system component